MSQALRDGTLLCGLPGDLVHDSDTKDYTVAKVGGLPVFPGDTPPSDLVIICHVCGKKMVLVVQVPAATAPACPGRTLMLWACTMQHCAKQASSWRAFSCQLPSNKQGDSHKAPHSSEHAGHGASPGKDTSDATQLSDSTPGAVFDEGHSGDGSWFTNDDSWGGPQQHDNNNVVQTSDAFDFSDLEHALNNSQTKQSKPAAKSQQTDTSMQHRQHHQQHLTSCGYMAGPQLPGFYLNMVSEAAGASASMTAEDQHIAELVAAYQYENQQAGPAQMTEGLSDDWSGETYEEDKEGAFHKFCMQLQRVPQQCIRYSWGGTPLWPQKQKPSPGQCQHCGAQRVFEMQVLAPVMRYIEETCTWLMDEGQSCSEQIAKAMQALSSWQWLTVAVFSCPNACQTKRCLEHVPVSECVCEEQAVMLAAED